MVGTLYHWSPLDRRARIAKRGLLPNAPAEVGVGGDGLNGGAWDGRSMLCCATTPLGAWRLSGGLPWTRLGYWDLWEVTVGPGDEVHVLPVHGPYVSEVRIANRVPKSRCQLVGSRRGDQP